MRKDTIKNVALSVAIIFGATSLWPAVASATPQLPRGSSAATLRIPAMTMSARSAQAVRPTRVPASAVTSPQTFQEGGPISRHKIVACQGPAPQWVHTVHNYGRKAAQGLPDSSRKAVDRFGTRTIHYQGSTFSITPTRVAKQPERMKQVGSNSRPTAPNRGRETMEGFSASFIKAVEKFGRMPGAVDQPSHRPTSKHVASRSAAEDSSAVSLITDTSLLPVRDIGLRGPKGREPRIPEIRVNPDGWLQDLKASNPLGGDSDNWFDMGDSGAFFGKGNSDNWFDKGEFGASFGKGRSGGSSGYSSADLRGWSQSNPFAADPFDSGGGSSYNPMNPLAEGQAPGDGAPPQLPAGIGAYAKGAALVGQSTGSDSSSESKIVCSSEGDVYDWTSPENQGPAPYPIINPDTRQCDENEVYERDPFHDGQDALNVKASDGSASLRASSDDGNGKDGTTGVPACSVDGNGGGQETSAILKFKKHIRSGTAGEPRPNSDTPWVIIDRIRQWKATTGAGSQKTVERPDDDANLSRTIGYWFITHGSGLGKGELSNYHGKSLGALPIDPDPR